jgi:hypothetical protein
MPDELRQIRDQVLNRLQSWGQTGVPDWKYALLLARSFEAVPWAAVLDLLVVDDGSPTLAGELAEAAHRWAGGGRLTQAEVDAAVELADRVVAAQTSDDASFWARVIPLVLMEGSPHVEWLRTALTDPRRAVAQLLTDMDWAGRVCPDRQERCLRVLFRLMECLHPTRAAVIDPRWRTADTLGVARGIVEDRAHDRLPLLADALMDAGCDDDYILSHCRSGGWHPAECWTLELFALRGQSSRRPDGEFGETVEPTDRPVPAPGRQGRVAEGMAVIARLAGAAHPNLVAFAHTGTLRNEDHRAAVQAELAALAGSIDSDAEARSLARLLEIMPSAPVGVCVH